jgi:hypothetical protein
MGHQWLGCLLYLMSVLPNGSHDRAVRSAMYRDCGDRHGGVKYIQGKLLCD